MITLMGQLMTDVIMSVTSGDIYFAVTTATITWYGRLSLSLQLHPSICKDPEGAKQVLAT